MSYSMRLCVSEWSTVFPKVWEAYRALSVCQTERETKMLLDLERQDYQIEDLKRQSVDASLIKQEVEQYRRLLDEIKKIVERNTSSNS